MISILIAAATISSMPRITSLELFGERSPAAFSEKAVKYAADAGYNAVFVNGGCGFGSEAMPPESLLITEAIPDLMPYTAERNIREVKERIKRLSKYGMKPWICWWTGVGTDDKANQTEAPNIRCRRELYAKYRKSPEMFGTGPYWRWRGNRPICISHPKVREFYAELFERLPREYPELDGVFFFPGDAELENCTDDCPNCAATGLGRFDRMARFANEVYAAWVKGGGNPEHFYYAFWNLDQPNGGGEILSSTMANTIAMLAPGMGLAMTICDNTVEKRVTGDIILNQPWSTCNRIGSLFKAMIESEQAKGRPVMVVSEISQSELFDPVCANMPFTLSTLELFRNCLKIPNCNAIVDFWGNRPPYEIPDACHEVMKEFMKEEIAGTLKSDDEILLAAAGRHYGDAALAEKGLAAWKAFDKLCREFPLCGWGQRISFAVGRTGARGPLYLPLVPPALKLGDYSWAWHLLLQNDMNPLDCYRFQKEAMPMYEECAAAFDAIGTDLARDEALRVRLFGKMNLSIGAFVAAQALHRDQRFDELRTVVEEELKNRVDELMMSFDLMPGSGVNNIAVEEDIGNMSLYLSDPEFPNSPDSLFNFQPEFGHTYTF